MKTVVVNLKRSDFDVYIGRPGKWGNPFEIGKDGTRKQVIEKFENYIRGSGNLLNDLEELQDKRLGCFCKPKACHGDVLVKLLKENTNNELLTFTD